MEKIIKSLIRLYFSLKPPEMVRYFKKKDAERALVTERNGYLEMIIDGEKYSYMGFPRGHLLSTKLSRLKHRIKERFFNQTWQELEEGKPEIEILKRIKGEAMDDVIRLAEGKELVLSPTEREHLTPLDDLKFLFVPSEKMVPAVRELWRVLGLTENKLNEVKKRKLNAVKKLLCFLLQEDDAYRLRYQMIFGFFNPKSLKNRLLGLFGLDLVKVFAEAMEFLEYAEATEDMKGRIRLWKRVFLLILKDPTVRFIFDEMCREMNFGKVRLTEQDKYYLRAKWIRADFKNPKSYLGRLVNDVLY